MSNTSQIIEERSRDIGDFLVGRLLPFRKKRMVGPFIFIDHMGPSEVGPGKYMDIGQHPHIGLSTLTYLFAGEIMHRDTVGSNQRITPGSVNWMTAGKGVVHTERTPQDHRADGKVREVHGFQIWVALPKEKENIDPAFQHVAKEELPRWTENGVDFTLVAGEAYGKVSPVNVYSPLFMLELKNEKQSKFSLNRNAKGEVGICVVKGSVTACNEKIVAGNMLVSKVEDACDITINENSHLLLFGGEPFDEKRFINWNFVATSKDRINEAREMWKNGDFELITNGGNVVPLP
ncbi:MAG: pirin family protein [Bacteroidia bacterium]